MLVTRVSGRNAEAVLLISVPAQSDHFPGDNEIERRQIHAFNVAAAEVGKQGPVHFNALSLPRSQTLGSHVTRSVANTGSGL